MVGTVTINTRRPLGSYPARIYNIRALEVCMPLRNTCKKTLLGLLCIFQQQAISQQITLWASAEFSSLKSASHWIRYLA